MMKWLSDWLMECWNYNDNEDDDKEIKNQWDDLMTVLTVSCITTNKQLSCPHIQVFSSLVTFCPNPPLFFMKKYLYKALFCKVNVKL